MIMAIGKNAVGPPNTSTRQYTEIAITSGAKPK